MNSLPWPFQSRRFRVCCVAEVRLLLKVSSSIMLQKLEKTKYLWPNTRNYFDQNFRLKKSNLRNWYCRNHPIQSNPKINFKKRPKVSPSIMHPAESLSIMDIQVLSIESKHSEDEYFPKSYYSHISVWKFEHSTEWMTISLLPHRGLSVESFDRGAVYIRSSASKFLLRA